MKIKIIRDCQFSGINAKKGQFATVQKEIGEKLVEQGVAKSEDYISRREKLAEQVSAEHAIEILENLPTAAIELVHVCRRMNNRTVLQLLSEDKRKSVRKAAKKRLIELK